MRCKLMVVVVSAVFGIVSIAKSNQIMRCLHLHLLLPVPEKVRLVELALVEVVAFDEHLF